jgi:hypothetical protein
MGEKKGGGKAGGRGVVLFLAAYSLGRVGCARPRVRGGGWQRWGGVSMSIWKNKDEWKQDVQFLYIGISRSEPGDYLASISFHQD